MKQTLTRDAFIHNLKSKDRSDQTHHNIMILGHAVFDLHDAVIELLERTKDLYHPTFAGPKIKTLKIAPLTPKEEAIATKEQEAIDKKTGVTDASKSDEGVESF